MISSSFPISVEARVDAYRTTGSSPGRSGRASVRIGADSGARSEVDVAFEVHGPEHGPVTVVLGGISAGRHLAPTALDATPGWWPGIVGTSLALDPGQQRLLGIDFIGASGGPGGGLDTPTTHDQARALAGVLDALGCRTARIVGASYGGMIALAFAEIFPERVSRLVVLCAAHRTHPMATGLRSIQRAITRLGLATERSREGLSLARALAMTTYRSAREFDERFPTAPIPGGPRRKFPVEEYLDARGASFARHLGAEIFIALSESVDLHAVDPRAITAPTTLVSFDTDGLVPPWLMDELEARAPGVERHQRISSRYGHDGFLKETRAVSRCIAAALAGREEAR
jgi:homoserine O-acetyltransferase/O-succinyltransferase